MGRLEVLLLVLPCLLWSVEPKALPAYLVIGQQKSGTSTLWALSTQHPQLAAGASGNRAKEPNFFQFQNGYNAKDPMLFNPKALTQYGVLSERCDRSPRQYINMWRDQLPGNLAGDFSALHLSCHCCPEMFQRLIPHTKIIAILREPVARSLSRFMEQYNWPFGFNGFVDRVVSNFSSFAEYANSEVEKIERCLDDAKLMLLANPVPGGDDSSLKDAMEYRCLVSSNIVGWSAYSVFLRHWLKYFPKEQLMVLYTSDLDSNPKEVMRRMEQFLGINAFEFDDNALRTKFNTKQGYGWSAAVKPVSNSTSVADLARDAEIKKAAGKAVRYRAGRPPIRSVEEMQGDTTRLVQFLKPYMLELQAMADMGIINPIPADTMAPYL